MEDYCVMECHGMLGNVMEYFGMLWLFWKVMECYEMFWLLWNVMECYGCHGLLWNVLVVMDCYDVFWLADRLPPHVLWMGWGGDVYVRWTLHTPWMLR